MFAALSQLCTRGSIPLVLLLAILAVPTLAKECSTEKVNDDCTVTIDRSYPLTPPQIQMREGKHITVLVLNPLPFETLSLDLQTSQAIAGTDQTAGLINAILPNLKNLSVEQSVTPLPFQPPNPIETPTEAAADALNNVQGQLISLFEHVKSFARNASIIYDELNEVIEPLPPTVLTTRQRSQASPVASDVPRPWVRAEYQLWVKWMSCELAGREYPSDAAAPGAFECGGLRPPVRNLLTTASLLSTELQPSCGSDDTSLACQIGSLHKTIDTLPDADKAEFILPLKQLDETFSVLSADGAAIATIDKDLLNYSFNISHSSIASSDSSSGEIGDPRGPANLTVRPFLGRQVVFGVNALNEISSSPLSVTPAAQKKTLVTISVLYADPILEVSAGTIFSTLPNRSFANQTAVAQNPSGSPTLGNVSIAQTLGRPTVVPFAAGNWRLGHDFLWPDARRGAFYFTTSAGVNVNNVEAEFGAGFSVSWRSLMLSALYDWGHDVRLTQGEYVGMIWCNQTSASGNGSIPKCSGTPPAPSTEKYWRGSIAIGISVRVPSVFGSGGGGSGH